MAQEPLASLRNVQNDRDRLALLKDFASRLPEFSAEKRTFSNRVMGCTTQVRHRPHFCKVSGSQTICKSMHKLPADLNQHSGVAPSICCNIRRCRGHLRPNSRVDFYDGTIDPRSIIHLGQPFDSVVSNKLSFCHAPFIIQGHYLSKEILADSGVMT